MKIVWKISQDIYILFVVYYLTTKKKEGISILMAGKTSTHKCRPNQKIKKLSRKILDIQFQLSY